MSTGTTTDRVAGGQWGRGPSPTQTTDGRSVPVARGAADGTAQADHEHTEVCGHVSQTGGSGPAAGGIWGAAGGRIGPSDQGPGGAPVREVGETSRQPGVGGTPGLIGVGVTPTKPVPGGPPAASGAGETPDWSGGGGGGTATTGLDGRTAHHTSSAQAGSVWLPLRGNEQLIDRALARRMVLLVDDHRALVALEPGPLADGRGMAGEDIVEVRVDGGVAVRYRTDRTDP